jgi:RNA polymerase sigma factor (TIGR02999 family)
MIGMRLPRKTRFGREVNTVTLLLRSFQPGDDTNASRLMELIYPELKKLARSRFRSERDGHVLQPTALVNEAYVKLVAHEHHNWETRAHFYAAAGNLMRRILIDYARARNAAKRGGERTEISLDQVLALTGEQSVDLLDLHEALSELEQFSPRQARVVELRYFVGLSVPEVARALGVNARSVDRDWAAARAWLRGKLKP